MSERAIRNSTGNQNSERPPLVVCLGAGAGGLPALESFFQHLPEESDLAFVVMARLGRADDTARLSEVLERACSLEVVPITDGVKVQPNRIYLSADGTPAVVRDGRLLIGARNDGPVTPLDQLFYSLSVESSERSVGIVLSGAGTDGTLGLKALSDAGGMTMAQSPESAHYETMPRNAANIGVADHVLRPEAMPRVLLSYRDNLLATNGAERERAFRESVEKAIPAITDVLDQVIGHDFQHYKIATLGRRVQRRMHVLLLASVDEYLSCLRESPDEARALFQELLIGVTAFFRDPEAFEALSELVVRNLFQKHPADEPIRIWVPGCASGEEAYSIAILAREEMERRKRTPEVQIFATDIDDHALEIARQGAYPMGIADDVPPERLERFFVKQGQRFRVSRTIRELCLFSHHNLISDPPFSRLDLVACRNLLIYLGPHLQKKLIPLFHYALRPGGYLFLGPSENISSHQELFRTVDAASCISRRRPALAKTTVLETTEPVKRPWHVSRSDDDATESDLTPVIQRVLLDEFAPQAVVVDPDGRILWTSGDMSRYLKVSEVGFENRVLELAHTGLRVGLRTAIAEAIETKRRTIRDKLSVRVDGKVQPVTITVQPMPQLGEESELFMIVFEDVGLPIGRNHAKNRKMGRDPSTLIEQLEAELESTREGLEESLRDLETANEKLKSSNDELRSMNEELQSANEELQTRKEDVQAAHDALERAHSDLENLLLSTEIAVIILDQDGCIRSFTPAVTKIYNLIDSDVGRPLWHQTHRAIEMPPLPVDSELSELSELDRPFVEQLVRTTEGRSYARRVRPYRTRDRRRDGMIITFTDVTELTDSEERLRVLAESVPDIVFQADERLEWTYVNTRFSERTGAADARVLGDGWMTYLHPGDREKTQDALKRARETGEVFHAEHRLRRRDGSYRWFVTRAVVLRAGDERPPEWFGTMTDVEDLKRTQEALRRSEQQRRLALAAGRLGVYELDLDDGTITLDQWAREILGTSKKVVPLDEAMARVHPDDRRAVEEIFENDGEDGPWVEFRVDVPGRQEIWIAANAQVQFGQTASGLRAVRLVGTLQEITERKRAEQELQAARASAESASRAKSQFLANMSHEIRTPMTAILGYTDVLAKHSTEDKDALEYVETIRRNGRFLLELLNDVLDLSKIEAGQLEIRTEQFRPDTAVAEVRSLMEAQAIEKGIELLVEFDGELPEAIESDPNRLRQVLLNLVSNAIKFTERGSVRLLTRARRESEELEVEVIDTGVGIPADQQQTLFDPFAQADSSPSRRFMGTGLGLTISRRLAHMLGGGIHVESEPGKGSTFRLTVATGSLSGVPFRVPSVEIVVPNAPDGQSLPNLDGSILVVDDRREGRALARHFLEEAGARVQTASDGLKAIDQAARAASSGNPFDLVLMDMQMPGMDGYEAVSRLRAKGFQNPIIALTAHAMRGEREKCLAAGCDDYASKPIDSRALVAMIAKYLARTREKKEEAPYRILLVDDNRDLLESKRIILESRGHEVRIAGAGAEALEAVRGFDAEVVILDLGLPDMTGHDLLAKLKDMPSLRDAVFLALSGRDDEVDRERSAEAGFHAHVVKPAGIDELEALASDVLRNRR